MLDQIDFRNLLIIDIETVPQVSHINELNDELKALWREKALRFQHPEVQKEENELYFDSAGILSEFGKVICISTGVMIPKQGGESYGLRIKSYVGNDEKQLLNEFAEMLNKIPPYKEVLLGGHNINEFDVPFLSRRILINGLTIPTRINNSGKKPWEVNQVDTMQLWKFGDHKHFTSLKLLCSIFNIPSSKTDIEGKDVGRVYWFENGLTRIGEYCNRDVVAVAQLILRFKGLPLIDDSDITLV